jgi:4a-hydroxytetrahydrobiopterin dehydratase
LSRKAFPESEIRKWISSLPHWTLKNAKLHREFKFKDFIEAFSFMTEVAKVAEELNHHPDWTNVYNTVTVFLQTHDAGGITEKDFELARKMDELYSAQLK